MSNQTVLSAIDLLISLATRAAQISTVVASAQAEGRVNLTVEEWRAIDTEDDSERQRLVDQITKARQP
jgi:uncharacterized protein YdbL (DUF1318 family)